MDSFFSVKKSMADFKKWYICLLVMKIIKINFGNECVKYSCPVVLKECINITEPLKKHESSIGSRFFLRILRRIYMAHINY